MKFSCERVLLQNAVTVASRAAAVKSAIASLEGILIEADNELVISAYDLKTGIRTSVPADVQENGSVIINARLFGDIIRKLNDDVVTIATDEGMMTRISCGLSEFNILGMSSEDYPELPSDDYNNSLFLPQKTLKAMISQTNFAVSDNEARPIHTGSLFEAENGVLTVVSVDGYRLALRKEKIDETDIENCSFVVPGTALAEVEKIAGDSEDPVKITLGTRHIMFSIDKTVLISRRLEGEFLNYRNAVPKTNKYRIIADKKQLIDAVDRVSLIISEKLKSPVRCIFGDGVLKISAVTPLGKATDECEIKGNGDDLEIGFNNKYLLDALKAVPADTVAIQLASGVSPCVIVPADESSNFLYMILPVRLKANES